MADDRRSYFVEARSDNANTPSVLFNCGSGSISHVEIYSQRTNDERLRVIFRGDQPIHEREYILTGHSARSFLDNLKRRNLWESEETTRAAGR